MREPGTMLTIAPWVEGVQRHPLKRGRQSLRQRRDYIRGPYSVPKESESMGGPFWPCLHHKDSGQSRKKVEKERSQNNPIKSLSPNPNPSLVHPIFSGL